MIYAITEANERIEAFPEAKGVCPCCKSPVRPKCGSILCWHFAHVSADCDPWSEPETLWHRNWKNKFPVSWQEVVSGNHRADVKTPSGLVIEFQHSAISFDDILRRELHYQKMKWIWDASSFEKNFVLRRKDGYCSFRWKHPRKTLEAIEADLYFDFSNDFLEELEYEKDMEVVDHIFHVRKINFGGYCGGWGRWVHKEELIDRLLEEGVRQNR